jgi:3-deoxy-7-phosphoheptulonate synthase
MIIIMRTDATQEQIREVCSRVESNGLRVHLSQGVERTVIGAVGDGRPVQQGQFLHLIGVERVVPITQPYKLASRQFKPEDTIFSIGDVHVGGAGIRIIAGPCAVESRTQIVEIAHAVREAGGDMLRGGAYKPRTSPYSFQGLGETGLEYLAEAREATGLPVVTEVMAKKHVPLAAQFTDVLQIGARNMQNFDLPGIRYY